MIPSSRVLRTTSTDSKKMYPGIYTGSVVSSSDPTNSKRVTLRIPQVLGTAVSNWAVPLGYTITTVPSPGTLVHVAFDGGDINHPIYITGH